MIHIVMIHDLYGMNHTHLILIIESVNSYVGSIYFAIKSFCAPFCSQFHRLVVTNLSWISFWRIFALFEFWFAEFILCATNEKSFTLWFLPKPSIGTIFFLIILFSWCYNPFIFTTSTVVPKKYVAWKWTKNHFNTKLVLKSPNRNNSTIEKLGVSPTILGIFKKWGFSLGKLFPRLFTPSFLGIQKILWRINSLYIFFVYILWRFPLNPTIVI